MKYLDFLDHIGSWVRFSDTKAGVIVALGGSSLAFAFSRILDVRSVLLERDFDLLSVILYASLFFYVFFLARAVWKAFHSVIPRLDKEGSRSLIFYKHIAEDHQLEESFVTTLRKHSEQDLEDEVIKQVHALSKVATRKYELVAAAIRSLAISAVFWIVLMVLLFWLLPIKE